MTKQFKLEDPGEGIHEAEILDVMVAEGDSVEEGDIVLSVETDKAAIEIPAPFSGTIESIKVKSGQQVEVGSVLMTYSAAPAEDSGGDAAKTESADGSASREDPSGAATDSSSSETSSSAGNGESTPAKEDSTKERDNEAATTQDQRDEGAAAGEEERDSESKKPAADADDETDKSEETATEADDGKRESEESAEAKNGKPKSKQSAAEAGDGKRPTSGKRAEENGRKGKVSGSKRPPVPAAPSTRRLARELNVELHTVEGSGPGGRVTADDVEAFAEQEQEQRTSGSQASPEARQSAPRSESLSDFGQWGEIETQSLSGIRKVTAKKMVQAWSKIPHVTHQDVADITRLEQFRQEHRERVEREGGKLSLTVLIVKAVAAVLGEHPRFNASLNFEDEQLIFKRYYHIGVAVDTDDGLLVPVLRDVDRCDLLTLSRNLARIVEQTRQRKIKPADMKGGTFTVTNPGPGGGTGFTPIIRHPEVAILGLGAARRHAVYEADAEAPTPRLLLPLCLAFDHRVNDGADAMRFVKSLKERLSDPDWLLLSA